jgi:hypothetical protein
MAAHADFGATDPGLRVAAAWSECGASDRARWNDLHREPSTLRRHAGVRVRDIKVKNEDLLFGDMWTVRM